MQQIDGKGLAQRILTNVQQTIEDTGLEPKLAVLLVGDDPASHVYVNLKEKRASELGIATDIRRVSALTTDEDLKTIIEEWNADESVDAILIQVPLPEGHDTDALIATMDPRKDVDGFHPSNAAALLAGEATLFPPVHEGILRLIGATDRDMRGVKAVVIANSETFSAPLARLLTQTGCFVTETDPDHLERDAVHEADIIIIAVGRPGFLKRDIIKSGAVIIDVGTNRLSNGTLVGDVEAANIDDIPGWISPVPGGVGPMTIAVLLKNVVEIAKLRRGV